MSSEKSRSSQPSPRARARGLEQRAYTSREAAEVSDVPFFTLDYWGRTEFLVPTVARGAGRGKGRQRMYSYGDLIRLRIARELREQKVSLETLRALILKLAGCSEELAKARFVLVGREVEIARSTAELVTLLRRPGRGTFGILLDLSRLLKTVRARARALAARQGASAASGRSSGPSGDTGELSGSSLTSGKSSGTSPKSSGTAGKSSGTSPGRLTAPGK